jgi:adenosylmethionine-8-amino-7-oxononanoate aminotransferase
VLLAPPFNVNDDELDTLVARLRDAVDAQVVQRAS